MNTTQASLTQNMGDSGRNGPERDRSDQIRTVGEAALLLGIAPRPGVEHAILTLDSRPVRHADHGGKTKSAAAMRALNDVLDMDITAHDAVYIACGEFPTGTIKDGRGGEAAELSGVGRIL